MIQRTTSLYVFAMAFAALLIISDIQELYSDDLYVSATCSITTLNGAYGFYRAGDTPDGPLTAVGKVTFDGKGNSTTKQNVSRNGEFETSKFSGRYEIAPDCTLKIFNDTGDLIIASGIIVDDGNGFFIHNRAPGNVFYTVGRKIHSK